MGLLGKRRAYDQLFLGSKQALERLRLDGPLRNALIFGDFDAHQRFFDDFDGDTLNTDLWALANSGGAAAANFAKQVGRGGWARGNTGTTDNGSISAIGPLEFYGDANAIMQARFKFDVVTGLNFEVGLIDAVPAANGGAVNDEDTPTFNAGDFAGFVMDTDETNQALSAASVGSVASGTDQVTALSVVTAPVADNWLTVRIQLIGNMAYFLVKEESTGKIEAKSFDTDADGHIEGGVALAPWIYCRTRAASAVVMDLDYVYVKQERR